MTYTGCEETELQCQFDFDDRNYSTGSEVQTQNLHSSYNTVLSFFALTFLACSADLLQQLDITK